MAKNNLDVQLRSVVGYGPMTPTAKDEEAIARRWQELSRHGVEKPSQRGIKADLEAGKRVLVQRGMPCPLVRVADGFDQSILEFTAASGGKKRDGNSVDNNGWVFNSFADNPIFLWCHDYSGLPLGHHVGWSIADLDKQAVLRTAVKFASRDVYPFADTVRKLYVNRDLRTVSAGWIPLKWRELEDGGILFLKNELLEVSGCPIPADPQALMAAAQRGVISSDELENCARWLPALALARDVAYVMSNIRVVGSDAEEEKPEKDTGNEDSTKDAGEAATNDKGEGAKDEGTGASQDGGSKDAPAGDAEKAAAGDASAADAKTDQGTGVGTGGEPEKPENGSQGRADGKNRAPKSEPPTIVNRDYRNATLQPGQVRGVLSDRLDVAFDKLCGPAVVANDILYDLRNGINNVYWSEGDGVSILTDSLRRGVNRLHGIVQAMSDAATELDDACTAAENAAAGVAGTQTAGIKDINAKVRKAQAQERLAEIEKMQSTIGEISGKLRDFAVDLAADLGGKASARGAGIDPALEKIGEELRSVANAFRANGEQTRAEPSNNGDESSDPEKENGNEAGEGDDRQEKSPNQVTAEDILTEMRRWSADPTK